MTAWLTDPFALEFMQRALAASLIVGVLCSVIGTFDVLRAMAFLGDALAHAILPGVAVAYLLGADLLLGALVAAVLVAVGVGLFSRRGALKEDTAIGILFAAALALGVLLMSTVRSYASDLTHILFGNVLGVSPGDLWLTGGLAVVVLTTLLLFFKEFQLASFDPVLAHMLNKRPEVLRFAMLILLALTIVCLLYTSDAADDLLCVDLGGRRLIKKTNETPQHAQHTTNLTPLHNTHNTTDIPSHTNHLKV